ncbi:hypothetical protein, partial [Sphingobium sp. MK2]|uniref:hypothetical protein n=1 Tax=Sphingobium sp. MK2 TaxID=3116540 RepID=UPI0032E36869
NFLRSIHVLQSDKHLILVSTKPAAGQNDMKHEGGYLATAQDYHHLAEAVSSFWSGLAEQESVGYR